MQVDPACRAFTCHPSRALEWHSASAKRRLRPRRRQIQNSEGDVGGNIWFVPVRDSLTYDNITARDYLVRARSKGGVRQKVKVRKPGCRFWILASPRGTAWKQKNGRRVRAPNQFGHLSCRTDWKRLGGSEVRRRRARLCTPGDRQRRHDNRGSFDNALRARFGLQRSTSRSAIGPAGRLVGSAQR